MAIRNRETYWRMDKVPSGTGQETVCPVWGFMAPPITGGHYWPILSFPPGILSTWKVPHVLPDWAKGSNVATHENIWRVVQVCKDILMLGLLWKSQPVILFVCFFIRKLKVVDCPMQTHSHPHSKIQTKTNKQMWVGLVTISGGLLAAFHDDHRGHWCLISQSVAGFAL